MSDVIVIDGDLAFFNPNFGPAIVAVRPGVMQASGKANVTGKKACVVGDEKKVSVPGCVYTTGQYSIPGVGTLTIEKLADNQSAAKTATGSKKLILKGSSYQAKFTVSAPANQPPPGPGAPIPDTTTEYSGAGNFAAMDATVKAL